MGTYEKACRPWSPRDTPWDFGHELLARGPRPHRALARGRLPAFPGLQARPASSRSSTAPSPSRRTATRWSGRCAACATSGAACGVMAGFSQGGGVGLALANWMIHGDPGFDVFAMDVARFGDWATLAYTNAKVRENYRRRFSIRFPNEELPAARPLLTTPIYDTPARPQGAHSAPAYGLEVPLWFAPRRRQATRSPGAARPISSAVGAEARAVRESVGLAETSGFAKYRVERAGRGGLARPRCWPPAAGAGPHDAGADAERGRQADRRLHAREPLASDWLHHRLGHCRGLSYALVRGHLPADGSVSVEALGLGLAGLSHRRPEGPRRCWRQLTARRSPTRPFRFMAVRRLDIGIGAGASSAGSAIPAISATRSG